MKLAENMTEEEILMRLLSWNMGCENKKVEEKKIESSLPESICENAQVLGSAMNTNFNCHSNKAQYLFIVTYEDGKTDANYLCEPCAHQCNLAANEKHLANKVSSLANVKGREVEICKMSL